MSNFTKLMTQAAAGNASGEPFNWLMMGLQEESSGNSYNCVYDISGGDLTRQFNRVSGTSWNGGKSEGIGWNPIDQDTQYYPNGPFNELFSYDITGTTSVDGTPLDTITDSDLPAISSYDIFRNVSFAVFDPDNERLYTIEQVTNNSSVYRRYMRTFDATDRTNLTHVAVRTIGADYNIWTDWFQHVDFHTDTEGLGIVASSYMRGTDASPIWKIAYTGSSIGAFSTLTGPAVTQGAYSVSWYPDKIGFDKNAGGKASLSCWTSTQRGNVNHQMYLTDSTNTVVNTVSVSSNSSSGYYQFMRGGMTPQYVGDKTYFYVGLQYGTSHTRAEQGVILVYETTGGSITLRKTMNSSEYSFLSDYLPHSTAVDSETNTLYVACKSRSTNAFRLHQLDVSDPLNPSTTVDDTDSPFSTDADRKPVSLTFYKSYA